jgi:gliding motility-associated lipoprotein GldJ
MMGMGGKLNDHSTITSPVDAYWPNEFGLYCMAGNVNEWVLDVYRVLTSDDEQEYNPFRGNEYKVAKKKDSTIDGENVRVPEIDSLGRVKYVYPDASKDSMALYVKLDVRNYKDGDAASALDRSQWKVLADPAISTKKLYDPDSDAEGMLTSKISNTTRVYKGGGWKDRAYWLNPGQRRYLEQSEARSDIGFRCAMSKVGAEDGDIR